MEQNASMDKLMMRYVRGSLEAFLENKRTLKWIKGVISKSGILQDKELLREIFDGLGHYKETARYRMILKEFLKENWITLDNSIIIDTLNWTEWEDILSKASKDDYTKGGHYRVNGECLEFWVSSDKNSRFNSRYIGLAYPDRLLSSKEEAIICAQVDNHRAQESLYRQWREGKISFQEYRKAQSEIQKIPSSILDWIIRRYKELKSQISKKIFKKSKGKEISD